MVGASTVAWRPDVTKLGSFRGLALCQSEILLGSCICCITLAAFGSSSMAVWTTINRAILITLDKMGEAICGTPSTRSVALDSKGTEQRALVVLDVDLLVEEFDAEIQACTVELGQWTADIRGVLLAVHRIVTVVGALAGDVVNPTIFLRLAAAEHRRTVRLWSMEGESSLPPEVLP